jgi:hypothetical protein
LGIPREIVDILHTSRKKSDRRGAKATILVPVSIEKVFAAFRGLGLL